MFGGDGCDDQSGKTTVRFQASGAEGAGFKVQYPASTAVPNPWCQQLLQVASNGSGYTIIEPYTGSTKTSKIDPEFGG